jgi:hypothetical protein
MRTMHGARRGAALAAAAALLLVAPAGPAHACAGDCNDDDVVAVNEVITMVNVSLETQPLSSCQAGDVNDDGTIAIDEIITAVGFALDGCAASPPLQPCTGGTLTTCAASCGGPGRDGCCPLTTPPACFDPTNGSIQFTQCGSQPSAACVLGSAAATPTATSGSGATLTATSGVGVTPTATPVTGPKTQVSVVNQTASTTTVYVSFGADSAITQDTWASFCTGSGLTCQFTLPGNGGTQALPNPTGAYLNATFAFNSPVGCNATKAEVNVNNPNWYDILDVSLVDGYSNNVAIIATPTSGSPITLGPPNGASGNESVYGLYPLGCDVCVARCSPPCGISKSNPLVGCDASCNNCQSNGVDGCKGGSQTAPTVPCQYQGSQLGGGGESVQVVLMN